MNEMISEMLGLLEDYYGLTTALEATIQLPDEQVDVETIRKILLDRDQLIEQYIQLESKLDKESPTYNQFVERKALLINKIKLVEDLNQKSIRLLLQRSKATLKNINSNKQAVNAYYGSNLIFDGVFIDKRK